MTELTELSSEPLGYFASNANTTFVFGSNHTLYLKARILGHLANLNGCPYFVNLQVLKNGYFKVELKSSKFGKALVLNSSEYSGSYVLGFRLDPAEKLHRTHKELVALHKLYSETPIFGIQFHHKV